MLYLTQQGADYRVLNNFTIDRMKAHYMGRECIMYQLRAHVPVKGNKKLTSSIYTNITNEMEENKIGGIENERGGKKTSNMHVFLNSYVQV